MPTWPFRPIDPLVKNRKRAKKGGRRKTPLGGRDPTSHLSACSTSVLPAFVVGALGVLQSTPAGKTCCLSAACRPPTGATPPCARKTILPLHWRQRSRPVIFSRPRSSRQPISWWQRPPGTPVHRSGRRHRRKPLVGKGELSDHRCSRYRPRPGRRPDRHRYTCGMTCSARRQRGACPSCVRDAEYGGTSGRGGPGRPCGDRCGRRLRNRCSGRRTVCQTDLAARRRYPTLLGVDLWGLPAVCLGPPEVAARKGSKEENQSKPAMILGNRFSSWTFM